MKLKGIKIRLYPNKTQESELNSILGGYRFVYNKCLAYKKEAYERDKTSIDRSGLSKYFHNTLRVEYDKSNNLRNSMYVSVSPSYQNKGIAKAMYDYVTLNGFVLKPALSGLLEDGIKLWNSNIKYK